MKPLDFDAPVVFIGNADVNWAHLKQLPDYPVIAVDGGANDALNNLDRIDYIIGDFDSANFQLIEGSPVVQNAQSIHLPNQDHTDFAKTLAIINAPVIYAYGFLGGRMDHTLDALAQISHYNDRRVYLIGQEEIAFLWPAQGGMDFAEGRRISLWSAGQSQVSHSFGLKWPLDGMTVNTAAMSISNETQGAVTISYVGDPMIAFVDVDTPIF